MLSIGKFAKSLGVSIQTLRNWDKEGKLKPTYVTENGYRYYSEDLLNKFRNIKNVNKIKKKNILYARVSTKNQKDDLNRQIDNLKQYAYSKGYSFEIITDIGSGINYKKEGLLKMINLVECGEVDRIIVLYKDRLIRFGYDLIEYICKLNDTKIEIVDNSTISKEQELTEDLIQIITIFANRLYGARSKKTINLIKSVKENADR
ncbi:IS607 family transposase [Leptotrichia sp. oral taxon 221]|mgnify:FL=1|uniref:IS607 family transposase n=1 Tax=Leptotrichia sp. oral taxon 221 TaxID=712362 RepID=UPI001B8C213E|nr:IS607 family transposase [Leptotrichia sp. oral taxon 221]QUB97340.1 IS607 family transposase [Leptotrichia sp. oral taxon 221]